MDGCVGFWECVLIRSSSLWLLPFALSYLRLLGGSRSERVSTACLHGD